MVWFSRVSSVLCFGCHVVSSFFFGEPLLRDVTGKALPCSAVVEFVAPVLWHGLRLLPMVGSEVSVQRTGARWRAQPRGASREFRDSSDVQAMFKREKRERARALARRFKLSKFGHRLQAAGPIRASVRGGAPPARHSCKALSCM